MENIFTCSLKLIIIAIMNPSRQQVTITSMAAGSMLNCNPLNFKWMRTQHYSLQKKPIMNWEHGGRLNVLDVCLGSIIAFLLHLVLVLVSETHPCQHLSRAIIASLLAFSMQSKVPLCQGCCQRVRWLFHDLTVHIECITSKKHMAIMTKYDVHAVN